MLDLANLEARAMPVTLVWADVNMLIKNAADIVPGHLPSPKGYSLITSHR